MDDAAIVDRIRAHFEAIGVDEERAAEIYADDAVLEYAQSGERLRGIEDIVASRQAYPGRPARFVLHRVRGNGPLRVAELTLWFDGGDPHEVAAILELDADGAVTLERLYLAERFEPAAYRAGWVETVAPFDAAQTGG